MSNTATNQIGSLVEEPAAEPMEPMEQTKILDFYRNLDGRAKLAVALYRELLQYEICYKPLALVGNIADIIDSGVTGSDEKWLVGVLDALRAINAES